MMNNGHFVFDTNVIVSALLFKQSTARQAFDKALRQGKLLVSVATVNELNVVLRREKFNKYLLEEERLQFLAALLLEAIIVEITATLVPL
jgi:uncharacterized protein